MRFFQIPIVKNFSQHLSGTVIGAALGFIMMPIFTRYFTPDEFGLFYLYLSIVNTLPTIITLRYEQAILLPTEEDKAKVLVWAAMLITIALSILLCIITFAFGAKIAEWLGNVNIRKWYVVIFISSMIGAFNQILNFWLLRRKEFFAASANKVILSSGIGGSTIFLGHFKIAGGLILGDFMGKLFLLVYGVWQFSRTKLGRVSFHRSRVKEMFVELKKYKKFPIYNSLPALLDKISLNLPVIIITSFFGSGATGMFNLPRQVIGTPVSLLTTSLSQVYFQRFVEMKNNKQRIFSMLFKSMLVFAGVAIIISVVSWFFSSEIFAFIFGEKWRSSGEYSKYLAIAISFRLVVSPFSVVFPALEKIKQLSFWQVLYFLVIISLYFFDELSFLEFIKLYVFFELFVYTVYLLMILYAAKTFDRSLKEIV